MNLSRRLILMQLGGGAFAAVAAAQQSSMPGPTPEQTEGPFYPAKPPAERDADLTRLAGRAQRAAGPIIEVRTRVLDRRGQPVNGAHLELWQANAAGKYDHPGDGNAAPIDPNFQGYASLTTGPDGIARIITVKPGAYPSGTRMRTPHLHWKVAVRDRDLTTQMYFPGEPMNADDRILRRIADPRSVIARSTPAREAGASGFDWDIVLDV